MAAKLIQRNGEGTVFRFKDESGTERAGTWINQTMIRYFDETWSLLLRETLTGDYYSVTATECTEVIPGTHPE